MPMMRSPTWVALAAALGLVTIGYTIIAPSNFSQLGQMRLKESALQVEIETAKNHIQQLHYEAENLSGDSPRSVAYLARIAREEFGFVGKDEVLILLDPNTD